MRTSVASEVVNVHLAVIPQGRGLETDWGALGAKVYYCEILRLEEIIYATSRCSWYVI